MDIEIKNCNNITMAKVAIVPSKLNIKFAPNGTGKSTISKAIQYAVTDDEKALADLLPFKFRSENVDDIQPDVLGIENIKSVLCFNEEYVNKFTFKPEELVSNSFDIFIRTDAYQEKERDIETFTSLVKQQFANNTELEALLSNLNELSRAFKVTASGGLAKTSTGAKALSNSNKIDHIPAGLQSYQPFIQSSNCVNWIDWESKGHKEFSDLSDSCPFCTSDATSKKDQIANVSKEYDKNLIKNLVSVIDVINKLGEYFSDAASENLDVIKSLINGLEKEHETFIVTVKSQIDDLMAKLEKLKGLTGFDFNEGENVGHKLLGYKIDLQFFDTLNSIKTNETIAVINQSIDDLIKQAGPLQGKINQQRTEIQRLIKKHQTDINDFLTFAGYRYQVAIVGEGEQAQLKLRHIDNSTHLSGGSQHLSFGERNAFSIVLFMYECLAKKPDLIILDDPISSFDKNKKYAILEMLFRRKTDSCLKNKTVLMLTHDVEPIIDTIKSLAHKFSNQTSASFLKLEAGQLIEYVIRKEDMQTFSQICKNALASDKDDVIKLIYMRRHFEISDDKGDAYQVLSNILHKRGRAIDTREPIGADNNYPEMAPAKFSNGCNEISGFLNGFSYSDILNRVTDVNALNSLYRASENGYEKLQIFRLLDLDIENSVVQKFINETYHIENEFICQLDPARFDTIPEYVISECDRILQEVQ